ncbi:MAG: hypothetical protein MI757_02235 [Pirellulales bacterium]|nr:hypothetical protein [Pirellulales bacterium]
MRRTFIGCCLVSLLVVASGCACGYPPIFGQGPPFQNFNFGRFDPFPDAQAGPPLVGTRPPGAEYQRSEPSRVQAPYSNSSRGAILVP